jgi:hypothetical protein
VDGTGSGMCQMTDIGISDAESLGSGARELVEFIS